MAKIKKCKLCGIKGVHTIDFNKFVPSELLMTRRGKHNDKKFTLNYCYICRRCVGHVLDAISLESYRIRKLFEPEIKKK